MMKRYAPQKPNLFIVGAPKCGTTSLANYLKLHPEIFVSKIKEPNFFDTDSHGIKHCKTINDYLNLFKTDKKIRCDASPWYLYSKCAAKNIYNFNAQAKIVIILRNPVNLIYSLYNFLVYKGAENSHTFEAAIKAEPERKKGINIPKNCKRLEGLYYSDVIKFSSQIEKYYYYFEKNKIKIIIFEEYIKNIALIYKEVLDFLDVDASFLPNFKIYNQGRTIRNRWLHNLMTPLPKSIKFIIHPIHLIAKGKLDLFIRNINTKPGTEKPIAPETRERLYKKFKPEIIKLEKIIDKDLSVWKK